MVEGFWIAQFEGTNGRGSGVVTFIKNRVFGGDSGSTYVGTYRIDGNSITAHVRVHTYIPGGISIIGMPEDYDLEMTGTIQGDVISASGIPVGQQVAGMAIRLTRVAKVPT